MICMHYLEQRLWEPTSKGAVIKGYDIYKIKNPDYIYWDETSDEIIVYQTSDSNHEIVKTPKWLKKVILEATNQAYNDGEEAVKKELRDIIRAKKE